MSSRLKHLLVIVIPMLFAPTGWAHGINLFATVEGSTIQGTLLYADGTPAAKAPVTAFGPNGDVNAEAKTDESGRFSFQTRVRCRHRLVGDAGQGHRGLFTIAAEDLSASLPTTLPEPVAPLPESALAELPGESSVVTPVEADAMHAEFDARLEAAVARQLRPLREQIDRYEKKIRIRDVIGGIGYLFGLVGLVVLLKHRSAHRAV